MNSLCVLFRFMSLSKPVQKMMTAVTVMKRKAVLTLIRMVCKSMLTSLDLLLQLECYYTGHECYKSSSTLKEEYYHLGQKCWQCYVIVELKMHKNVFLVYKILPLNQCCMMSYPNYINIQNLHQALWCKDMKSITQLDYHYWENIDLGYVTTWGWYGLKSEHNLLI